MENTTYIWMDGKLVKWDDAKVHVLTHSLHYGSAVFEGIRAYETAQGAALFRLKDHMERFFSSGKAFGMEIPFSKRQLQDTITEVVRKNRVRSGYVRPLAYYGEGYLGFDMRKKKVHVAIAVLPWMKYTAKKSVRVKVSSYLKISPRAIPIEAKVSGIYANSIMALRDAQEEGFESAILLDEEGFVAEGPTENILMVKDGKIIVPKRGTSLQSITKASIMEIASDRKIGVVERRITVKELRDADELFFAGTGSEITPIVKVDNKKIGDGKVGKITEILEEAYSNAIHGRDKKYRRWLTVV